MSIDNSARAADVGVDVAFGNFNLGSVRFLPMRVALVGQGNTAKTYVLDKYSVTSSAMVAARYGFGSPLHLASKELLPANNDGLGSVPLTVYPLVDDGSGVIGTGDITASGTQTADEIYQIKVNEIPTSKFQIPTGTTASAAITMMKTQLDATLDIPTIAGANTGVELILPMTSKWKGESANDVFIEIDGDEAGITFVVTQLVGGAVNPDIDDALGKIGSVWETIICNCLNYDDTDTLDALSVVGEARWNQQVKTPLISVFGTIDDRATRTAITDIRPTDRINIVIPSVGSNELPSSIGARAVARIGKIANNNPAKNYKEKLTGIVPGTDAEQEDYTVRDLAVKAGSSTTILVDGVVKMQDTYTMYHPAGQDPPAYGKVCNIIKLMNVIYNVRLIFESPVWDGMPLLDDASPTTDPDARKTKDAIAILKTLAENLALKSIISDLAYTLTNITSAIAGDNGDRLNNKFPVKLSGNVEIIDNSIFFDFFYGS